MKSFALAILLVLCVAVRAEPPAKVKIEISVTKRGFDPETITVPARQPVTLVFTRKTEETCTRSVVVTLDDGKQLERPLPLDKPVEIPLTFARAGKLGYACSMNMNKGVIVVQ